MSIIMWIGLLNLAFWMFVLGIVMYLLILCINALKKYINTKEVREEKKQICKSLGELLKEKREQSKMTQEFVAEKLEVSRQAVSKWEKGSCDPSTSNLLALCRLYGISAEEILQNTQTKRQ